MSRKLAVNVTTPDETGRMVTYMAGDSLSGDVAKAVTAKGVWADDADGSDYGSQQKEDLQAEADKRGLEVQGSGKDGNVVKADLVSALEADDA